MNNLSNAERETHFNLVADDRNTWEVFSDDPVMIARLDKICTAYRVTETGKHYHLPDSQVTLRKPKKPMSEAHKAKLVARLAEARQPA